MGSLPVARLESAQAELALDNAFAPERLLRWDPERWPVAEGWRGIVDAFLSSSAGLRLA